MENKYYVIHKESYNLFSVSGVLKVKGFDNLTDLKVYTNSLSTKTYTVCKPVFSSEAIEEKTYYDEEFEEIYENINIPPKTT